MSHRTNESHWIAPEGLKIVLLASIIAIALMIFHVYLGILGLCFVIFCLYFFRNPRRIIPKQEGVFVSPADGEIIEIATAFENDHLKRDCKKIVIFMSPFNVHINRSPETGTVNGVIYHKGDFLGAFKPEASNLNERSSVYLKTDTGLDVVFVQIAGWLARRIITYPVVGDILKRGDIMGLIRFGSRVDVYLPIDSEVMVENGQHVRSGETILARKGEI